MFISGQHGDNINWCRKGKASLLQLITLNKEQVEVVDHLA